VLTECVYSLTHIHTPPWASGEWHKYLPTSLLVPRDTKKGTVSINPRQSASSSPSSPLKNPISCDYPCMCTHSLHEVMSTGTHVNQDTQPTPTHRNSNGYVFTKVGAQAHYVRTQMFCPKQNLVPESGGKFAFRPCKSPIKCCRSSPLGSEYLEKACGDEEICTQD
jgi:hypothetical protein